MNWRKMEWDLTVVSDRGYLRQTFHCRCRKASWMATGASVTPWMETPVFQDLVVKAVFQEVLAAEAMVVVETAVCSTRLG
jgi:hypothetical protein